ncbi:DUF4231 domain-containing protein [Geodermatophilus sp. SYSU D00742]
MTIGTSPGLRRSDLPAICRSAADLSARGQRRTKVLVRVELLALVLAGAAGVQSLRVGPAQIDVLAGLAGCLFLVSLASLGTRLLLRPEAAWYRGRAAAESVRTLAWRYAVGAHPFPSGLDEREAAARYLARLAEVLHELRELELAPTSPEDTELTPGMAAVRAASSADRRAVYKRDRLDAQITWYTQRADDHDRAARTWVAVTALASSAGVLAAALRMFGVIDIDLLGVAASGASAAIAWNQLDQNRTLVSAYRITARELGIIRDRIDHVDDSDWPTFVSDSEDAVSREHTLWLARRGHRGHQ